MSIWIILSWIFVAILTAINIFVFLKLKQASEQMMKMAFPGAKNMNEAVQKMQQMMGGMGGAMGGMGGGGMGRGSRPGIGPGPGRGGNMDQQLRSAMDMLQKMQQQKTGKR